jgi:uracil-DNA glycosylase
MQMNKKNTLNRPEWDSFIENASGQPYFGSLMTFLENDAKQHVIYPPKRAVFAAFEAIAPQDIKVVILGQDPYHGPGQANGLAFSVFPGVPMPPSLRNIFKALHHDLGVQIPLTGDLSGWAQQGVFLLNRTLTVRAGLPGSHYGKGWELFTEAVLQHLSNLNQTLVFMLWGSKAQETLRLIHHKNHLVLTAPHPSPLSAHRGFMECKHFSKANEFLTQNQVTPIAWEAGLF